jgi:hypothetical protein
MTDDRTDMSDDDNLPLEVLPEGEIIDPPDPEAMAAAIIRATPMERVVSRYNWGQPKDGQSEATWEENGYHFSAVIVSSGCSLAAGAIGGFLAVRAWKDGYRATASAELKGAGLTLEDVESRIPAMALAAMQGAMKRAARGEKDTPLPPTLPKASEGASAALRRIFGRNREE